MTLVFYLTIMVHIPESNKHRGAKRHLGGPALALRTQPMVLTLASTDSREVVRCDFCSLVQYRTTNSLCRKCRRPLDVEEPVLLAPQLVAPLAPPASAEAGLQVAGQVREIRRAQARGQLKRIEPDDDDAPKSGGTSTTLPDGVGSTVPKSPAKHARST